MKTVLISIQPQYLIDILNGKKTLELRTVVPNIELPCKYVIYCSKEKHINGKLIRYISPIDGKYNFTIGYYGECFNGKVVAEFICNEIPEYCFNGKGFFDILGNELDYKKSCLSLEEILKYAERGKNFEVRNVHTIKIDDLKIYDKPKELNHFNKFSTEKLKCDSRCYLCPQAKCNKSVTKAPQSYMFVEEVD